MKIGFVLDDGLDSTDGVQQNILTLGRWLTANGHEVHYIVGETHRKDIKNIHSMARNVRVKFNGNVLSIPLPVPSKKISSLLQELNLDVIHIQAPYSPLFAGRLARLAHKKSVVYLTFHILAYSRTVALSNYLLGRLNYFTKRYFDEFFAVSEPAAVFAKRTYGYRCRVMPNPFTMDDFTLQLAKGNQKKQIVFLGRLVERKGCMQLLQAVAYLKENKLFAGDFEVKIGGKGDQVHELKKFMSANGLNETVEFLGFIDERYKAKLLSSADIAVFPSIAGESFGISLLEAMAAARGVVIAGNNPGYSSVMTGKLSEQLIEPRRTKHFAMTLAAWLGSEKNRLAAAKRQKIHVKQFDVEEVGKRLLEHYNNSLHSRYQS